MDGTNRVRIGGEFRARRLVVIGETKLREFGVVIALLKHKVREALDSLTNKGPITAHGEVGVGRVGATLTNFHPFLILTKSTHQVIFRANPVIHGIHIISVAIGILHAITEQIFHIQRTPPRPLDRI